MIQFTEQELRHLQEKAEKQPVVLENLKKGAEEVFREPILVPEKGIGNWFLYYYCPKCSVLLNFNRHDSEHHVCPECGKVLTGEPYHGTWWGIINSRNSGSCFQMGLIYAITKEMAYARKAIDIMVEYSKYYKDYEVHGDIPYNGPGKANAQTLDEANFLRSFAMAYDLLSETMTEEEQTAIRDGMLLPGAEFLVEHRHMQLHNHEVIINSAIAIIGLIFEKEEYIQLAVYGKYGILYQLENAVLSNDMWFEGAFGYHFYALTSFFAYEKFALHTSHSHIQHPNYKAMMNLLFSYLEPGFRIPMLNDTNYGHTSSSLYLYEFAYRELGGEKLLYVLNRLYEEAERDNLEAFIYGVDELPPCELPLGNYHTAVGSFGHSVVRGKDDRYLLFKHDSYGGEHDHYDRLDISYLAYGKRIAPDMGTTGYGALMHYDYYKNTGSHNTVNIGGENQAPANAYLTRYEEKEDVIYMDAEVDWTKPYEMPDTFTIVQWKEENYRTVRMERRIAWTEDYFADVFTVEGANPELSVDWVMHMSGKCISEIKEKTDFVKDENWYAYAKMTEEGRAAARKELQFIEETKILAEKKPYKHIHDIKVVDIEGVEQDIEQNIEQDMEQKEKNRNTGTEKFSYQDEDVVTDIYSMINGQIYLTGMGANNPSISEIPYLIERNYVPCGKKAVYAHVIASRKIAESEENVTRVENSENVPTDTIVKIQDVKFELDENGHGQIVVIEENGKTKVLDFH